MQTSAAIQRRTSVSKFGVPYHFVFGIRIYLGFIEEVLQYDITPLRAAPKLQEFLRSKKYFGDASFSYARVLRASAAAVALFRWCAQEINAVAENDEPRLGVAEGEPADAETDADPEDEPKQAPKKKPARSWLDQQNAAIHERDIQMSLSAIHDHTPTTAMEVPPHERERLEEIARLKAKAAAETLPESPAKEPATELPENEQAPKKKPAIAPKAEVDDAPVVPDRCFQIWLPMERDVKKRQEDILEPVVEAYNRRKQLRIVVTGLRSVEGPTVAQERVKNVILYLWRDREIPRQSMSKQFAGVCTNHATVCIEVHLTSDRELSDFFKYGPNLS